MLEVAGRAVAGKSQTEGPHSSRAFIDFEGFDTYTELSANQWRTRYNVIRNHFVAASAVGDNYGVDGSGSLVLTVTAGNYLWLYGRALAYAVTPHLPTMTGATKCFFEMAHMRNCIFGGYVYSICSSSGIDDPTVPDEYFHETGNPQGEYLDYRVDLVDKDDQYIGGTGSDKQMNLKASPNGIGWHVNNPVYDPSDPTEQEDPTSAWNGPQMTGFSVSRYSVPKVITDGHPYVGVCLGFKDEPGWQIPGRRRGRWWLMNSRW